MIEQIQTALIALTFFMAVYVAVRQHKLRRSVRDFAKRTDRLRSRLKDFESSLPEVTEPLSKLEIATAEIKKSLATLQKTLDGLAKSSTGFQTKKEAAVAWKQTEALLSVYRLIDGAPTVPPTGGWAASADLLCILLTHIAKHQPATILECGGGTSTIAMAYAAQRYGGRIFSIENDSAYASGLKEEVEARGLTDTATIIHGELTDRSYPSFDHSFKWYGVTSEMLPRSADMLVIDGPPRKVNPYARYPAGPELFRLLSPNAHIFLDDTNRPDDGALPEMWRSLYPRLNSRVLAAEKGAMELFFAHTDGNVSSGRS